MDEQERREEVMRLRRQNEEAERARRALYEQAGGERAYREQERAQQQQRARPNLAGIRWENLASWRIWIAGAVIATLPAVLAGALNPAFGFVVFFAIIGVVLWASARPTGPVLYCPYCRKRVKMGASTCHHCGRTVTI
jgi:Flp pilus assembly protein TadB